jgi:hypothetical protein
MCQKNIALKLKRKIAVLFYRENLTFNFRPSVIQDMMVRLTSNMRQQLGKKNTYDKSETGLNPSTSKLRSRQLQEKNYVCWENGFKRQTVLLISA